MDRYSSGSIIQRIIGIILFCIFEPVIYFGLAYFGGWIMQMCIGTTITNGLNLMFDTTRFTPDIIPLACGTLATIGSFFKTRVSSNSSK